MLAEEKILIVGGSSGIGLAVARQAQQLGAEVVVASRHAPTRISKAAEFQGKPLALHAFDITVADAGKRLLATVGMIDHLVFTVRPDLKSAPFAAIDLREAKQAFKTKFWGAFHLIQVALPYIRKSGSITLTSGIAGEKVYKGTSTLGIMNSATEALARTLAVELAPIRVNVVSPGFVEPKPPAVQKYADQFPVPGLATVEEVALAYLYLLNNPYATGTITVIDGGARLL